MIIKMAISNPFPIEVVEQKIFIIRSQKVMLSMLLAELYGVGHKVLMQSIKRNLERFPEDFMFLLTKEEALSLKSHFATSSWGGVRKLPRAFTQEGVAMLSGVLSSERAIMVNIQIMRAFTHLRRMLLTNKDLKRKIEERKC